MLRQKFTCMYNEQSLNNEYVTKFWLITSASRIHIFSHVTSIYGKHNQNINNDSAGRLFNWPAIFIENATVNTKRIIKLTQNALVTI
jgi:hypothetical protein